MSISHHNFLRACRKKTPIPVADMAYLLEHVHATTLVRYEKGKQEPSLEAVIAYMVAFDCTMRDIFPQQFQKMRERYQERIPDLSQKTKNSRIHKLKEQRLSSYKDILKSIQKRASAYSATNLSLYPNGQGCGYAVFKNEQELYELGMERPKTYDIKKLIKNVKHLIDLYQPDHIVLRGSETTYPIRSKRVQSLLRKLKKIADSQGIPVTYISAKQIGATFACFDCHNQHDRTQKLREWFPNFDYQNPLERKTYTSKDPRQYAFDALAQGVTFHFLGA